MPEESKFQRKDILESFSEKFPLLQTVYGFYNHIPELSKSEEDTLRKSSEITTLEILELIVIANRQVKGVKADTLYQAAAKLDTLKVFVDLAKEMKKISEKTYSEMEEQLQTLGKMIGGWAKAVRAVKA